MSTAAARVGTTLRVDLAQARASGQAADTPR